LNNVTVNYTTSNGENQRMSIHW